jgi:hypothetical protein
MDDYIFICYRRDDTAGYAGRLYDRLVARFGEERIFMDIDGIGLGTDFVEEIEKAVGSVKVQIVMIGRRWATIKDSAGNRRLDDPDDYVRLEIESALKRRIRVVPALIAGAPMPTEAELPDSLKPLRRRQGIQISHAGFDGDVAQLIKKLETILGEEVEDSEPSTGFWGWWRNMSDTAKGLITLSAVGLFIGLLFWFAMILPSGDPDVTITPTADLTKEGYATAISQLQTDVASRSEQEEATPTANPLFGTLTAVIAEMQNATATQTQTEAPTLTPTRDSTATIAVRDTQAAITKTPEIDREPTLTFTSTATASLTASPTATLKPENPFDLQAGSPAYVSNIAYPDLGCNWLGVAGQVYDSAGTPIVNLGVRLTGSLGELSIDELVITGDAPQYGEGGFEFMLADAPVASSGSLSLQLLSDEGQPLSDEIFFDTSADCQENLVLLNMAQTTSVALASVVEEVTLSGKGMFIWKLQNVEGGNPDAIASAAAEADLSFVLIKVAEDDKYYRHITDDGRDLLPLVIDALHIKGIQVWGWHYVRGNNPREEALTGSNRVNELELDGYVISIGTELENSGDAAGALIFMNTLAANLVDLPVAMSAQRYPSYYPNFPVEIFLAGIDYVMPTVYWVDNDNPAQQLRRSIDEYSALIENVDRDVVIVPVGSAFLENQWFPSAAQIDEFMQTAYDAGLPAVSFWEWSNARQRLPDDVWNTIRDFEWE